MGLLDGLFSMKIFATGVELVSRGHLNFQGAGVTAVDNPTTKKTDVTIPESPRLLPTDIIEDGTYEAEAWDAVIVIPDEDVIIILPHTGTVEQGDQISVTHCGSSHTITINVNLSADTWELTSDQGLTFMRVNGKWHPISSLNPFAGGA